MRGYTVNCRAHAMLAHAEVQIPPGIIPNSARRSLLVGKLSLRAFEIAQLRQQRKCRWIQIRRAADQRRQLRRNRSENFSGCGARRNAFGVGGKVWNRLFPSGRQHAANNLFKLFGEFRKFLGVRAETLFPTRFDALGRCSRPRESASTPQPVYKTSAPRASRVFPWLV